MNSRALIFAIALLAGLAAACASEQRADDPQPTVSREARADRLSTLPAETPPADQQEAATIEQEGEQEAEPEPAATEAEQADAAQAEPAGEAQSEQPDQAYVSGTIQSGWRAGVQADRNVLGDPDAEIVITEWSDYQ